MHIHCKKKKAIKDIIKYNKYNNNNNKFNKKKKKKNYIPVLQ